jgi:putative heme iron utilization protein
MLMSGKASPARTLFLRESFGVLSTTSLDVPGFPFGSVVPYCVDALCRPIIYISHIAQHTRNILADPRVSLTVLERMAGSDDVQAFGRVTCLANAQSIENQESEVRERYFRHFPSARQYEQTHDFAFFRLEPVRVRFIGGFGQIYWLEPDEFSTKNPFSFEQESRIIEHMNKDHAEALRRYAGDSPAVMTGIDAEGFDLHVSGRKVRVEFDKPVHNMEQARQALIAMSRRPV